MEARHIIKPLGIQRKVYLLWRRKQCFVCLVLLLGASVFVNIFLTDSVVRQKTKYAKHLNEQYQRMMRDLAYNTTCHNDTNTMNIHSNDTVNKPVFVVIAAYQRTGSSYLGQLFNRNPSAIYWFEPLDAVYSSIYGTRYGWNVPEDLWHLPNGSARTIPDEEHERIVDTIVGLLTCNFSLVPYEVLLHKFMTEFKNHHQILDNYTECLNTTTMFMSRGWNKQLSNLCGRRFQETNPKQHDCYRRLRLGPQLKVQSCPTILSNNTGNRTFGMTCKDRFTRGVMRYNRLMTKPKAWVDHCLPNLANVCQRQTIRSLKSVRLSGETLWRLKKRIPEVYIIHNMRDPHGVVLSRSQLSRSFRSIYNTKTNDMTVSAGFVCRDYARDTFIINQLAQAYPNTVYRNIYERTLEDPILSGKKIYDFLGLALPVEVNEWLLNNTRVKSSSTGATSPQSTCEANPVDEVMSKWKSNLTVFESECIDRACAREFKDMAWFWPK